MDNRCCQLILCGLLYCLSAEEQSLRAQGTVNFSNGAQGVNAPFRFGPDGSLLREGEWKAELLLLEIDGSTRVVGGPLDFASESPAAGYFFGGSVTIQGIAPGAVASFRVRVFRTNGIPAEATSEPIRVSLGGALLPPANLIGLRSIVVTPMESSLKISITEGRVRLFWSSFLPSAKLESSTSLSASLWKDVEDRPGLVNGEFSVSVPASQNTQFFRLRFVP